MEKVSERERFERWIGQGNGSGCNETAWRAWQASRSLLSQEAESFDKWAKNPYTIVLQKSIAEDYAPKESAASAVPADMKDAYVGAREDLLIWKRRALAAEKQASHLAHELGKEVNGQTFMGEPVVNSMPGYKLVPIEPTTEMLLAGIERLRLDTTLINKAFITPRIYKAMLEAAPTIPETKPLDEES